jgi:hypothetical protein
MEEDQVNKYHTGVIGRVSPSLMRQVVFRRLAVLGWLALFDLPQTLATTIPDHSDKPNFSGKWALDLGASTSLEPMMNQIGAAVLDRKYAAQTKLTATLNQTDDVLTVATRGPGFGLDQTLYLDGRNDSSNTQLMGATSVNAKAVWSKDSKELVETHQIKTNQGKDGQLTIKRNLIDQGRTLVVTFNLKLNAEPDETSARQIWRKQG